MRELLFRGKRTDNGEWVYSKIEVLNKTVGQFTGLLDKNGNKIFEGDIIKNKYNQINEIKFGKFIDTKSHEQVGFYQVYLKDDTLAGVSSGNMDYVEGSEIIGNIHDNGELYKENKGEIK